MFGRRRKDLDPLVGVDPAAVPPRYASTVADALASRRRWMELTASMREGAVRDRLVGMGPEVDAGVLSVWSTVQRLVEIERVTQSMDLERVTADLKRARRDPAADPAMVQALNDRFASIQRMLNVVDDADGRLRLLDARLGAAVARAAELALVSDGTSGSVGDDLASVVDELGALREALDQLG